LLLRANTGTVKLVNTDFWGPPKNVRVNQGPCYPKNEKIQSYSTLTMHTGNATPIIIIIIIIIIMP